MKEHQVALITGAASGIGKACALRLSSDGFDLALNYRSRQSEIDSLITDLDGDTHSPFQADISDPSNSQSMVENIFEKYGRIDVLVNAAGVFEKHDITNLEYDNWLNSWNYTIAVNLLAPVNLAFCVAHYMMKSRRGKIINITSRGAFRGEPDAPAYGASKAGLNSASQSLAKALGPYGISVFAVAPGWVDTPLAAPYLEGNAGDQIRAQSPLNRVGEPSEIANVVSFLAANGSDYLTGAIIDANGASYLRN